MSDTLGILYELRACYSRFDERQAPYYRALSEAIETMHNLLKQRKGSKMRLIDADAFRHRMYHEVFEKDSIDQRWDSGCWMRYRLFDKVLEEQPTVDAVEVIKCKDCKYGKYDIADRGMYCSRNCVVLDTYESDYCSYAERRKDES